MSRYKSFIKKLRAIGFTEGKRTLHFVYWICPCPKHDHVVTLVANHPSKDLFIPGNVPRGLGPHKETFKKM